MSAANTETPARAICSAINCSVFVLPVPVAPATSPCRFSIDSEMRIFASGIGLPSEISTPSSIESVANV